MRCPYCEELITYRLLQKVDLENPKQAHEYVDEAPIEDWVGFRIFGHVLACGIKRSRKGSISKDSAMRLARQVSTEWDWDLGTKMGLK